ncbi:hypothetical protein CRV02_06000 [Arcobacter sp. CECT 8989]|uniref:hypothetical protein n=1 Tax=Arcobacter sp. CECT 8989 TaxID=2044509 RepID=UPI00100A6310|nr:hypothetical protein [Arcobacter sp. CECT 8989]RXK01867.1 hypothetical protein CRV02_06000 [Arcobacter sp. CECT 8989]
MQLHHYDPYYKFYLYSEDSNDMHKEKAEKGLEIPFGSTIKKPPLEQCKDDEIPIFENNQWKIVKDGFWRPTWIEINYDAGRKMNTFVFLEPNIYDFMHYPSMPQLCSSALVGTRIYQSLIVINKKFSQCIEMHRSIFQGNGNNILFSPIKESNIFEPSLIYEFKTEMETIIFIMRRVLDSLVQLTDLMVNFASFEKTKKLSCESIGSIFSPKLKSSIIKDIIIGNDIYEKDRTKFLEILNNLFNGYKHSLMHDESFNQIEVKFPTFVGFLVKYANHKEMIQYHNHNAYHIMMGFQDCVGRILRNQNLYRKLKN